MAAGRLSWCHHLALRARAALLDMALARDSSATVREKPVVRTSDSAAGVITESTRS